MWVTSSLTNALIPTAVALGNFDGVHRGHRQVIWPVLPESTTTLADRVYATVVTFNPHPQEFFSGQPRCLLTPLQEKVALLQRIGVEQLVLLPFDRELASLTPDQFVHDILVQKLQARRISVGQDFCFGRQRSGTALDLQAIAATYGIEVEIAPLQQVEGDRAGADLPVRISSSAIRLALQQGDLETANHLLGYPYCLVGNVVEGQQLGRVLGFPTANLQLRPEKFVPCQGVYAVRVQISQSAWPADQLSAPYIRGVMNLGNRPTVDGFRQVAEVHLFDWTGDLYGQTLIVSLERFLRPEQKFASLEELKSQIQIDCSTARMLLATIGHNGTDS